MLSKIEIKNYRCFPSFRMNGLARVNLLVGKNNSGKTALLEAVQFLASGGDPLVLDSIARRRGEFVMTRAGRKMIDASHFFHGHKIYRESAIQISSDIGHEPILVRADVILNLDEPDESDVADIAPEPPAFNLKFEGGLLSPHNRYSYQLTREGGVDFSRTKLSAMLHSESFPTIRFVSTEIKNLSDLSLISNELTINRTKGQVVRALQKLDPDVQTYEFLEPVSQPHKAHGFQQLTGL